MEDSEESGEEYVDEETCDVCGEDSSVVASLEEIKGDLVCFECKNDLFVLSERNARCDMCGDGCHADDLLEIEGGIRRRT